MISMVIPTKDSERYCAELVDGIRGGVKMPDECVCIDGKSRDATRSILKSLENHVPTRILERKPQGVYDAWNAGVEAAKHEWIVVACADDLVYPGLCGELGEVIKFAGPKDGIIAWGIDIIDEKGTRLGAAPDPNPIDILGNRSRGRTRRIGSGLEALLIYLLRGYRMSFMALAFRKKLWEQYRFRVDIGGSADIDWLMEVHLRGWNTIEIPKTLAAWRLRSGSTTGTTKRVSRLKAHEALQARSFDRLAAVLHLDQETMEKLEAMVPAQIIYDCINGLKETRNLGDAGYLIRRALRAASALDIARLAWKKLGNVNFPYQRPYEQVKAIVPEEFLQESITPLETN